MLLAGAIPADRFQFAADGFLSRTEKKFLSSQLKVLLSVSDQGTRSRGLAQEYRFAFAGLLEISM